MRLQRLDLLDAQFGAAAFEGHSKLIVGHQAQSQRPLVKLSATIGIRRRDKRGERRIAQHRYSPWKTMNTPSAMSASITRSTIFHTLYGYLPAMRPVYPLTIT